MAEVGRIARDAVRRQRGSRRSPARCCTTSASSRSSTTTSRRPTRATATWSATSRSARCMVARRHAERFPDFPTRSGAALIHLIASHHGERDHGSPVEPMTIEAYILAAVDDLDATINQVRHATRGRTTAATSSRAISRVSGDRCGRGRRRDVCRRSPAAFVLALLPVGIAQGGRAQGRPGTGRVDVRTIRRRLSRSSLAAARSASGLHESGHVRHGARSSTRTPVSKASSFGSIPFFAITHDTVSPAREYTISAAGFWMQAASSEWLLTRRPRPARRARAAREGRARVSRRGVGGVRLRRVCARRPDERDTLSMAGALRDATKLGGRDGDRARGVRHVAVLGTASAKWARVGVACGEGRAGRRRRQWRAQ